MEIEGQMERQKGRRRKQKKRSDGEERKSKNMREREEEKNKRGEKGLVLSNAYMFFLTIYFFEVEPRKNRGVRGWGGGVVRFEFISNYPALI